MAQKQQKIRRLSWLTLKRTNTALLLLIIVINAYVLLAPLFPALVYHWDNRGGHKQQALEQTIKQLTAPKSTPSMNSSVAAPATNRIVISSMLLDSQIYETKTQTSAGVWRRANGSTPDKGGNTVIAGHRYTYTNPKGVLYYLNKVAIGDQVAVVWQQKNYLYRVASITEVSPSDTTVEANTKDARLTIYTCTPLWNPKDRLVVVAELESHT